jgi:hypothetical protein
MAGLPVLFCAASALVAALVPISSLAADVPATPEGAQAIVDFVKTYAGADAASEPALIIKPAGDAYLVAVDLAALTAPLKALGIIYEPATLTFKVFGEDDGAWRVEAADVPAIVSHQQHPNGAIDSSLTFSAVKSVVVLDPKLMWARSAEMSDERMSVLAHGAGIEESFEFGPMAAKMTSEARGDGAAASTLEESFGAISFNFLVDPQLAHPNSITEAKRVAIKGGAQSGEAKAMIDGLKTKPFLDAWAFAVVHSAPGEIAANAAALKTLLTAAAATQPSFSESGSLKSLTIDAPQGTIAVAEGEFGVGVSATGRTSRFEERIAAKGLALPDAMAPPMVKTLVPTAFDLAFKISGIDINAAAAEAVADMKVTNDGVSLSPDDQAKVLAALLSAGPLVVDVPPGHITAPQLDIAFEGKVQYAQGGKPTGAFTVHMRDFDKTVTAVKGLGPDAEKQLAPALAIAKGLAKAEADGALSWVGEIGVDGVMKVNGLPLGKAPF